MTETLTQRCSSLPLALTCPASQVRVGPLVDSAGPEARLGTAFHSVMALAVPHCDLVEEALAMSRAQAMIYSCDPDELTILVRQGWRWWLEMRHLFPAPETEVPCEFSTPDCQLLLTGHIDLLSDMGEEVAVLDWKTGRDDSNHEEQVRGYSWLALQRHSDALAVYAAVVRVREGTVDAYRWSRSELEQWVERIADELRKRDRFNPGAHCGFCRRALTCEAREAQLALQVEALTVEEFSGPWTPARRGALYDQAKAVAKIAEQAVDWLRAETVANGGTLHLGDGRQLQIVQQERRSLDVSRSLPILRNWLPQAEIEAAMTLSKTKVEAALSDSAPRGQKKHVIEEAMAALEAAEAVTVTYIERLEVKRATAAVPQLEKAT